MAFSYKIEQKKEVVLLKLKGYVLEEGQFAELYQKLHGFIEQASHFFVVDLAEVSHMNSSGLNLLIRLLTKCRNQNGDMIISGLPKKIENLLIISKLNSIFETERSIEAAMEKLAQKDSIKE